MSHSEIAQQLDAAAMQATAIPQISHTSPITLDEAYEIQRLTIQHRLDRGEKLIGIKMGFTSEAKMKQMGVNDMIWGLLTSDMLIENEGQLPLADFIHPRSEPEICFRLSKDVDSEIPFEELDGIVDGMCAAIEIIDSRFENFKFSLEDVVADNCSSSALVIGEWHQPHHNMSNLHMSMRFNGEVETEGNSNAILGDPWKSLQAATRLAHQYQQPLKKGHLVMAGAATAASFLKPNIQVEAEVSSLGKVSFRTV